MAEYVGGEPMTIGVGDPITFENKTDDSFSVDVGIMFRKSGLYRVTVDGKHTSVEIEPEIVRCKECKHRIEHKYYGDLGESAYTCEGNMGGWILPDGYCSYAERRTDG